MTLWHLVLFLVLSPFVGYLVSRGWHRGKIQEALRAARVHNHRQEVGS